MIDEWGEQINNISDEGVFDDTSLGDTEVPAGAPQGEQPVNQFPNVDTSRFPYAPTPVRQIHQVDANRYGLYQGGGPQVRAEFPGQRIHAAMSRGMQGMGAMGNGEWDLSALPRFGTADEAADWGYNQQLSNQNSNSWDTWGTDERFDFVTGAVGEGIDAVLGITGTALQMQRDAEMHDARMAAFSQQVERQNQLFQARLAQLQNRPQEQQRVRDLQNQLNAALQRLDQNPSEQNLAELMQLMMRSEEAAPPRPVWPWVVGGVAALGLGVAAIYFLTKD